MVADRPSPQGETKGRGLTDDVVRKARDVGVGTVGRVCQVAAAGECVSGRQADAGRRRRRRRVRFTH